MESRQPTLPGSSPDEMSPVLSAEQQARVLTHGRIRKVTSGETLVELNEQPTKVFLVVDGKLEAVRVSDNREQVFAICGPGMFTGELNLLFRTTRSGQNSSGGTERVDRNRTGGVAGPSPPEQAEPDACRDEHESHNDRGKFVLFESGDDVLGAGGRVTLLNDGGAGARLRSGRARLRRGAAPIS
jgi:hypothetical protein